MITITIEESERKDFSIELTNLYLDNPELIEECFPLFYRMMKEVNRLQHPNAKDVSPVDYEDYFTAGT